MQVFYVNIGGGELIVCLDFWELVDYVIVYYVGVKFFINGVWIIFEVVMWLVVIDYVDVQILFDGVMVEVNDVICGIGLFDMVVCVLQNLVVVGFVGVKILVVIIWCNVVQFDEFVMLVSCYGVMLWIIRL